MHWRDIRALLGCLGGVLLVVAVCVLSVVWFNHALNARQSKFDHHDWVSLAMYECAPSDIPLVDSELTWQSVQDWVQSSTLGTTQSSNYCIPLNLVVVANKLKLGHSTILTVTWTVTEYQANKVNYQHAVASVSLDNQPTDPTDDGTGVGVPYQSYWDEVPYTPLGNGNSFGVSVELKTIYPSFCQQYHWLSGCQT